MKNQKLFQMIDKFAEWSERLPVGNEFQAQRERLVNFYEKFNRGLIHVRNEMGSELGTLKERQFDSGMFKMFTKVYNTVIELNKEIDPEKPYVAAEKLVHYVLDKPNAPYIDNLDVISKHHLKRTNVDFRAGNILTHPEIRSIEALKKLALELRTFMSQHPIISPPSNTNPPPGFTESLKDVPSFFGDKEDKTKA